jgi:hypothetical protein
MTTVAANKALAKANIDIEALPCQKSSPYFSAGARETSPVLRATSCGVDFALRDAAFPGDCAPFRPPATTALNGERALKNPIVIPAEREAREPGPIAPPESRERWVPALASLGRDDNGNDCAKVYMLSSCF